MPRRRTSRRRETRYFVLRAAGQDPEIARISPRGAPSFFDPVTSAWVHDPLLATEIRMSDEWVATAAADLPDGVDVTPDAAPGAGGWAGGLLRGRRGRHAHTRTG